MVSIGLDCRLASAFGGLGRYTRELVSALIESHPEVHFTVFVMSAEEKWLQNLPLGNCTIIEVPYRQYSWNEQFLFPLAVRRSGISLLYSPHFNVPYMCPVPFVATVHDLILHRFPNHASFFKQRAYRVLMKRTVMRAKRIIAVSQFTASELREAYPVIPAEKISVVTEGVDLAFTPQPEESERLVKEKYGITSEYFLYIGNCKQHKNVDMLLRAHAELGDSAPHLLLVTGGKEAQHLQDTSTVKVLRHVPDEDLPALYSAARAFVTPSLYEGFCLPIAEAQACHTPVIACNEAAIPEVASNHARLVEPTESALREALQSPPNKYDETYTPPRWEAAAQQLYAILSTLTN